jgi:aryl-alcohol dehydrogenase-like predicted oxidoreductase
VEIRTLGEGGPQVSVVGLGCNNFGMRVDEPAARAVIDAAIEVGVTHFDTAEMYGGGKSEEFIGRALVGRRDAVTIATKFLPRPAEPAYEPGDLARRITEGCELSLTRLQTDHIDLYYQHYPDAHAPMEEALETLDGLVRQGKVLHVACSNYNAAQIEHATAVATERGLAPFVGLQVHWNVLERGAEESVIPAARRADMGIIPYFPLASGLLTGKYRRGAEFPEGARLSTKSFFTSVLTDENFDRVEALTAFAEERGHTVLELAVAWLAAQPGVASVIAGATSAEQVKVNAAAGSWHLSAEDLAALSHLG